MGNGELHTASRAMGQIPTGGQARNLPRVSFRGRRKVRAAGPAARFPGVCPRPVPVTSRRRGAARSSSSTSAFNVSKTPSPPSGTPAPVEARGGAQGVHRQPSAASAR